MDRPPRARRDQLALAVLCTAQLVVALDAMVAMVALPAIGADLGLGGGHLHWVTAVYALVLGGFVIAGGRAADALGRRRVFVGGTVLFTLASVACAAAPTAEALLAARASQGLGAAFVAPAALALISASFAEGTARAQALGAWAAANAFGAVAGLAVGGALTDLVGWRATFLAGVPLSLLTLVLAPLVIDESRSTRRARFDAAGAVLVTAALSVSIFAMTEARTTGWATRETAFRMAAAVLLLGLAAARQLHAREPLVPAAVLRRPSVRAATLAGMAQGGFTLSLFLLLAFEFQGVLGYTAFETGVAALATRVVAMPLTPAIARLVGRRGAPPATALGMSLLLGGALLLAATAHDHAYVALLPGLLVAGLGLAVLGVAITSAALEGVQEGEAGVVAGLLKGSQWVGGAVGLALVSLAAGAGGDLDPVSANADAVADGVRAGLLACCALAALGLIAALHLLRLPAGPPLLEPAAP